MENLLTQPTNLHAGDPEMLVEDTMKGSSGARAAWPSYVSAEDGLGEVEGQGMDARFMAGALDIVETRERVENKRVRLLEDRGLTCMFVCLEG